MKYGVSIAIRTFHTEIGFEYSILKNALRKHLDQSNIFKTQEMLNISIYISMFIYIYIADMKCTYIHAILLDNINLCQSEIDEVIRKTHLLQTLNFFVALLLIIILFIMTMIGIIQKFNTCIIEIKKLISVIPISITTAHIFKMKKAFKAIA